MRENQNPFEPPMEIGEPEHSDLAVIIAPVAYPSQKSDCVFFTFQEFATLFEEKLHQAFRPFGVPTFSVDETFEPPEAIVTVSSAVVRLSEYKISPWNKVKKWLLPFLGWEYRPATFEVVGQVDSNQHGTIPFRLYREFSRNRLAFERPHGEKINMLVGMESEAARVAAIAMRQRAQLETPGSTGRFWMTLLGGPLLVGLVCSGLLYFLPHASEANRIIHTVLAFLSTVLLTTASLPAWLYQDARAAYFYRITAAKSSWQLRAFPMIVGLLLG
ncbi:MAG: hypothetical protein KDD60_09590, partial [Bdellovibrionales bacterium]|nr:hypothetical protein [Bdellovibrionales bacterium]